MHCHRADACGSDRTRRLAAGRGRGLLAVAALVVAGGVAGSPPSGAAATGQVSTTARVVTVAGDGRPGGGGDGGPAVAASLDRPAGITVDAAGDLFIADTGECAVREVPAASGTQYGMAMTAHRIYTVAGSGCGGSGGIGYVTGVAVDGAGNLYVADATGNRIFELAASGGRHLGAAGRARQLRVVAGDGTAGFAGDGGPALSAELDDPTGVAVDGAGDLYIADTGNCRARMVPAAAGTFYGVAMEAHRIYTVAGTGICGLTGIGGPALSAELWTPTAVAVRATGDLVIADRGAGYVLQVPKTAGTYFGEALGAGDLGFAAGAGIYAPYLTDGLPALGTTAELNFPYGLAVGPAGVLVVSDTGEKVIREDPSVDGTSSGAPSPPGTSTRWPGPCPPGSTTTSPAGSTPPCRHPTEWPSTPAATCTTATSGPAWCARSWWRPDPGKPGPDDAGRGGGHLRTMAACAEWSLTSAAQPSRRRR